MFEKLNNWLKEKGFDSQEKVDLLLNPPHENDFHLLHNSAEACDFLLEKRTEMMQGVKHKIAIIGDYDCDGVTSTSILTIVLRSIGLDVYYYIPHRIADGYGLSKGIVDKIMSAHPDTDIVITCDNGIAAKDAVAYAKSKGLFVIVTDHHNINPDVYPDSADLVVHPAMGDNPFATISGAEVAWKVSQMLLEKYSPIHNEELETYLFQLMTVSIVSDVMPIASSDIETMRHNENRYLLKKGLESLHTNPDRHWAYIFDLMAVNRETLDETTIGFYIAPVVNATGRLETARIAVDALTANLQKLGGDNKLKMYSSMMAYYNSTRKEMKFDLLEKTRKIVDSSKPVIILQYPMHEGLVGIIAGNYADQYHRPCFVFTEMTIDGQKAWKGSARSPEGCGWNCFENLIKVQECSHSMLKFGGHAGAAGLTVLDSEFERFQNEVWQTAANIDMTQRDHFDFELALDDFQGLDEELKLLKPFGNGLPAPIIKTVAQINKIDLFFKSGHVKLSVENKQEVWLFGGLQAFLEANTLGTDYDKTSDNSAEKGYDQHWESWRLKKGSQLKWQVIAEYDYGASMNGGMGLTAGNARVKQLPKTVPANVQVLF